MATDPLTGNHVEGTAQTTVYGSFVLAVVFPARTVFSNTYLDCLLPPIINGIATVIFQVGDPEGS